MTRTFKRILSLLLAVLMLFALTACAWKNNKNKDGDDDAEDDSFGAGYDRASFAFENEYTRQHLEFIESKEYKDICLADGGLAKNVANNYEDAKLNFVNGTWTALSKTVKAVGEGEIELVNEYEILITELMQNTGAEDNFIGSFQENYFTAVIQLFGGIKDELESAKKAGDIFTGESLDDVEELVTYLDGAIAMLSKLDNVSDDEAEALFGDAMQKVKEAFDADFIKGNEKFIDRMTGALGVASGVGSFVSDTVSDVIEEYIVYRAMSGSSAEWETVWTDISASARSEARKADDKKLSESYTKVADCIDKILERTKKYREDNARAVFDSVKRQGIKNGLEAAYSAGYEVWDGMMKSWPIGLAVRTGMLAGVGAANLIANSDDIAYYGQMLIGYGRVATAAADAMKKAESKLSSKKDYESAIVFDKAFHIYKDIQMSAASCAINYLNSIKTSALGYIFKYTSDDEEAQIVLIQIHIADWMPIKCHAMQVIENNGGHVVGCNGNAYYFELTDDSTGKSGTFGNFSTNTSVKNKIVCRNEKGDTKTVATVSGLGNIYICGEKIFYRGYDSDWYSVGFDGKGEQLATTGEIIGYIEKQGMLILRGDNGVYATDFVGNRTDAFMGGEDILLAVNGDDIYYANKKNEGDFTFYRVNCLNNEKTALGSVTLELDSLWSTWIDGISQTEKGVYFIGGEFGGTGNFFQGKAIYYISFEDQKFSTVYQGFIGAPYLYVAYEGETEYVYFYTGMAISNTGTHYGALADDILRINTKSLAVQETVYPICPNGVAYMWDHELKINIGDTEPLMLISKSTAKELGYISLGMREDRSQTYHQWVDYVGGKYYISIADVVLDDSASVGWREGYRRLSVKMFVFDPSDKSIKLINSY